MDLDIYLTGFLQSITKSIYADWHDTMCSIKTVVTNIIFLTPLGVLHQRKLICPLGKQIRFSPIIIFRLANFSEQFVNHVLGHGFQFYN